jgi:hypothetical protein
MIGSSPGVIRHDEISYYNLGEAMDLGKYEAIDWDDEEEQPDEQLNNLLHCLRHGVDERVVDEVLSEEPVEIRLPAQVAKEPSWGQIALGARCGHCCSTRPTNVVTGCGR